MKILREILVIADAVAQNQRYNNVKYTLIVIGRLLLSVRGIKNTLECSIPCMDHS